MRKSISLLISIVLFLAMGTSVFASQSNEQVNYQNLITEHAKDLQLEENETYKEVFLADKGIILFNSVTVVSGSQKTEVSALSSNQQTDSMTSKQGAKNIFGVVLYQLEYTTTWTYDFDKVVDSSSFIAVDNGLGWSYKGGSDGKAVSKNFEKTHEWTGTASFAIIVGGMDISNETLMNHHRVHHDGTYEWKYTNT